MLVLPFAGSFTLVRTFLVRQLLDRVRLAGRARLVALDVVPREEDSVAGDNLAWLYECDVSDHDFLDVQNHLDAVPDHFDTALIFLLVEYLELTFLLPVVKGTDHDLRITVSRCIVIAYI